MSVPPLNSKGVTPASGHPFSSKNVTAAAAAPRLDQVKAEAKAQLLEDFGGDKDLPRKKLECNRKMKLGIFVGVVVGILVLAVVLGAVVASHGALGAALGIMASKLSLGSTIAAHAIAGTHISATWLAFLAKTIFASAVAVVFLGGGKIGGELWRRGEAEQMDTHFKGSSDAIKRLESSVNIATARGGVTEEEVQEHITEKQATILSSQAGRDFVEAKRMSMLHYKEGDKGPRDVVKAFGHFWTTISTTSLKSISDRKQYDMYSKNVALEESLKNGSVGEDEESMENLNELNKLRATQIEQLVWRTDAMEAAYAAAPEIQIYDRNINRLEALKKKIEKGIESTKDSDKITASVPGSWDKFVKEGLEKNQKTILEIDQQIALEKEKKSLLIENRFKSLSIANKEVILRGRLYANNSVTANNLFKANGFKEDNLNLLGNIFSPNAKVKSLLTIEQDVMNLPALSDERRGQILEAVSFLLEKNPKTTIVDVNELVDSLSRGLLAHNFTNSSPQFKAQWKTRKWVVNYSKEFAQAKLNGKALPPLPESDLAAKMLSEEKALMTREAGNFLMLRVLDIGISVIHTFPIPGSSLAAAGLTAVALNAEKGGVLSQIIRGSVNTAIPSSGSPSNAPAQPAT